MRLGARLTLMLAALFAFAALPAAAQTMASATMQQPVPDLKTGQFVWFDPPQVSDASYSPDGPVSIIVSLAEQRAYVFRDRHLLAVSTVSTGSSGRDTPTGEFTILQKQVFHRSNLYSDAPMPYMQRLTWDGIAMHAGHLPGYPASHGCIRLPKAFAKQLYQITQLGGMVSVVQELVDSPELYAPPAYPAPVFPAPNPVLTADTRNLGGESYNVVTMGGDAPAESAEQQPVSWVTGPYREIVQPLPGGTR